MHEESEEGERSSRCVSGYAQGVSTYWGETFEKVLFCDDDLLSLVFPEYVLGSTRRGRLGC